MARIKNMGMRAGEKRKEAIVRAAWELFMKKGYQAVSVDEIVKKAGGSKSSVYEYFGGKEGLFTFIIEDMTAGIIKDLKLPDIKGLSIRDSLRRIGMSLGRDILSEKGAGLYWLAVSVSRELPRLSRLFFDGGPRTVHKVVADYFKTEVKAGRLRIKDTMRASEVFHWLILEFRHMAMSLNCAGAPTDKELKYMVDDAVEVFLAAYGTQK